MTVIAICGLRGSGKSTLAEQLEFHHSFIRIRFAHVLKAMLRTFLQEQGLDNEKIISRMLDGNMKEQPSWYFDNQSPRYAQQTLGTEWGRNLISQNLWTNAAIRRIQSFMDMGEENFVIDDLRFINEWHKLKETFNARVVKLWKDDAVVDNLTLHPSEAQIQDIRADFELRNPMTSPTDLYNDFMLTAGDWINYENLSH